MAAQHTDSEKKTLNHFNRQVGLYSLAAAAAGVSLLALAEPVAGEVVITKKTIPIPVSPHTMPEPVKISMANNGVNNFEFNLSSFPAGGGNRGPSRDLIMGGLSGTNSAVVIGGNFYGKALALPRGAKIGPSNDLFSAYFPLVEASSSYGSGRYGRGYWGGNLKDHYLGVRFLISGQTHYGWIRLTVNMNLRQKAPSMTATITGYAYETVANKPILAGTAERATAEIQLPENMQNQAGPSLGMLALGAEALPLLRRGETAGWKYATER